MTLPPVNTVQHTEGLTAEDRLRLHVHDPLTFAFVLDDAEQLVAEIDALRSALRPKEAGQAGAPRAWYLAHLPVNTPDGPGDWNVDLVWGDDQPGGDGWLPLYAAPPPTSPAVTVGVKPALIEQWLIAAYARGVEWNEENPLDREYRFKAAGDWADKALNDPESELCRALTSPAGETAQVEAEVIEQEICGDAVNGGLIRDMAYTVWQKCHNPTHEDGNTDWSSDTLPLVNVAVERVRKALSASSLSAKESPEQLREAVKIVDEMRARNAHNGFLTDWWCERLDALAAALKETGK